LNIIQISGGLGNQMFQYALAESFIAKGMPVCFDATCYSSTVQKLRELKIDCFPNVKLNLADKNALKTIRGYSHNDSLKERLRNRFGISKGKVYIENIDIGYQSDVYKCIDTLICGYWQNEKYFSEIKNQILDDYSFTSGMINCGGLDLSRINSLINNNNTVSVHIRRKDYLNKQNYEVYGGICTKEYYSKAVNTIREIYPEALFVIFTDDPEWVRNNVSIDNSILINDLYIGNEISDLYYMSICKNHIIANSSFSWWGAWLGEKKNSIVIAPSKWFNNHKQTEMIPDRWIRI